jgi:hypothetical protein
MPNSSDADLHHESPTSLRPRSLGRPRGYTGKRKASEDLSTNKYSVKRQHRDEVLKKNDVEWKIELAKRADRSAKAYQLSKLRKTQEYLDASSEKRTAMETEEKEKLEHKWYVSLMKPFLSIFMTIRFAKFQQILTRSFRTCGGNEIWVW